MYVWYGSPVAATTPLLYPLEDINLSIVASSVELPRIFRYYDTDTCKQYELDKKPYSLETGMYVGENVWLLK